MLNPENTIEARRQTVYDNSPLLRAFLEGEFSNETLEWSDELSEYDDRLNSELAEEFGRKWAALSIPSLVVLGLGNKIIDNSEKTARVTGTLFKIGYDAHSKDIGLFTPDILNRLNSFNIFPPIDEWQDYTHEAISQFIIVSIFYGLTVKSTNSPQLLLPPPEDNHEFLKLNPKNNFASYDIDMDPMANQPIGPLTAGFIESIQTEL